MKYKRMKDRETLERLKRWPNLFARFPRVRIYSAEHRAWWRNTGQGYTLNPFKSAVWDVRDAFNRTSHCGPEKQIQFVGADNAEASGRAAQGPFAEPDGCDLTPKKGD